MTNQFPSPPDVSIFLRADLVRTREKLGFFARCHSSKITNLSRFLSGCRHTQFSPLAVPPNSLARSPSISKRPPMTRTKHDYNQRVNDETVKGSMLYQSSLFTSTRMVSLLQPRFPTLGADYEVFVGILVPSVFIYQSSFTSL